MKVAYISAKRRCGLIEKPMPNIKEDFALLRVRVAPMCNEYLAYGYLDFRERNRPDSLGHEAAGEIVKAGGSTALKAGDRVVALCGYPCGRCHVCRAGYYSHCQNTLNPLEACGSESGECAFAEYMLKQNRLLVPIPDSMSYEHASMACCGLGPAFGAMQIMDVEDSDTVLITGLGPVGLGGVLNGVFRGAWVIGVARNGYRRTLAKKLGAELVLDAGDKHVLKKILDVTDGRGVDCAIECSSGPGYQRLAIDATRRKGKVTFLAESGQLDIHLNRDIIQKGLAIYGSLDFNLNDAGRLIEMIGELGDRLDSYITHRFPLSGIRDAWERQLSGECGKVILYP